MGFDGWQSITIEDFVSLQRGHDLTASQQQPGKIPVMGSSGISGFHNVAKAKGPGVTIGRSGVGSFGVVNYSVVDYWPHNTVLYVTDFRGNHERFVYYFFKAFDFNPYNSGSAQSSLNRNYLYTVPIKIPPLDKQKKIAHILGILDDKIELNQQMNRTLEGIACAIFKSWFIDFDPVRAKLDGRQPTGMDAETAALFPDSFEDSPLGKIPKGWEVRSIGDCIIRLQVGKKYNQKTVSKNGKIPVLDQGKSGIIGYHNNKPGVITSIEKPVAVFANHTCYMRLITFPFSTIQNVIPFIGNGVNTTWLYYATLDTQPFVEYKGHWPDFVFNKIVVPKKEETLFFGRIITPIIQRIARNHEEIKIINSLREKLLPKLISGELHFKDAEMIIEEVA